MSFYKNKLALVFVCIGIGGFSLFPKSLKTLKQSKKMSYGDKKYVDH